MKRATLALAIGLGMVLGACSSGDNDSTSDTVAVAVTDTSAGDTSSPASVSTETIEAETTNAANSLTSESSAAAAAADAGSGSDEPCPDDGPRFPGTAICKGRVSSYFDPNNLPTDVATPAGCEWDFNETMLTTESEALLYRALSCKGVTTKLAYGGGAHSVELTYETSALFGADTKGQKLVQMFVSDPADPYAVILSLREGLSPEESAKCVVKKAALDGWPADALVMTYNDEAAKTLATDEPNAVCGEFGLDEDTQNYWLVRQGFAYFFTLGQEDSDIDPGSFTYITKDADGSWGAPS